MPHREIIAAIDSYLEQHRKNYVTPSEAAELLDRRGLIEDNPYPRQGLPVRRMLRKGKIPHAYQVNRRWYIPHSHNRLR
jgi:hypothetical protein